MPGAERKRLPRDARLLTKAEFDAVFASGLRFHSPRFRLHVLPNTGRDARLGLAVAKRVVKRSVDRNRLKRHAREAFRHVAAELAGFDFVLYAKEVALSVEGSLLQRELSELFLKTRARRAGMPRQDGPAVS